MVKNNTSEVVKQAGKAPPHDNQGGTRVKSTPPTTETEQEVTSHFSANEMYYCSEQA
jgi:hypothetical protein